MPALNLNQLPSDCFIWIKKVPLYGMNDYQIYFGDQEGELYQSKDGHKLGSITIGKASDRADSHVPAEHVWEVLSVMAQTGFGPLLYDLAMELAVKLENGKGMLKSDPSAMSDFAKKIWNYYYTSRPDVKWTQLDSPENELTPTFADNVHQDVSKKMYGKDWAKSPMSKGYSKNIELLNSPKIKIAESLLRIRNIKLLSENNDVINAGVLICCILTKRILVVKRAAFLREPYTWSNIGGRVEPGEDPKSGALRELKEETGFSGNVKLIPAFVFKNARRDVEDSFFYYYNFIGIVEKEFRPLINEESTDFKWISLEDLINLPQKHSGLTALLKNSYQLIQTALK